jgi:hypothetical protein
MSRELEAKIKLVLLGLIVGIAMTAFIGFKWGGWSTSKGTQKMVEEAVLTKEAAICADQYLQTPNNPAKLKEFAAIGRDQRSEFIEKGGWNKTPGQETADFGVSSACVQALENRLNSQVSQAK